MSQWTHAICQSCWTQTCGSWLAYRVADAPTEPCCYCERPTNYGIYVRADPATLRCKGTHKGGDG